MGFRPVTPEHACFFLGSGARKSKLRKKKEVEAKERAGCPPVRVSLHRWQSLLHDRLNEEPNKKAGP